MRKHLFWWHAGEQQRRIFHRKTVARHVLAGIIIMLTALVAMAVISLV